MFVKRGICRFVAEILGSKTLFSAFHKHIKKSTFPHFPVTLRFQTKSPLCFFRTADKTCVSRGVSNFFRHSDSEYSKIPKKSARRKLAKPRYFHSEIALRHLKNEIFLTPSGNGKNEKKKKK